MPDVIDEIIDKLSPSTLKMVLDFPSNDSLQRATNLDNLLNDIQNMKVKETNRDLERKMFDIKSKTAENKNSLLKLKNELDVFKSLEKPVANEQSIKAYMEKINELNVQVKNLTKEYGDVSLTELFNDIENLTEQIQDYNNKIAQLKNKYQCYEDFPPNIEKAKEAIAKVKEQIRYNESIINS